MFNLKANVKKEFPTNFQVELKIRRRIGALVGYYDISCRKNIGSWYDFSFVSDLRPTAFNLAPRTIK